MLIRSQDKRKLTEDLNVRILDDDIIEGSYEIWNESVGVIAEYSSLEQAVKVLDEIENQYKQPSVWSEYSALEKLLHTHSVFQMPEDQEY